MISLNYRSTGAVEIDNKERQRKIEFFAQVIGSIAIIILSSLVLSNILSASILAYSTIGITVTLFVPTFVAALTELWWMDDVDG